MFKEVTYNEMTSCDLNGFSMVACDEGTWMPEILTALEKFTNDNAGSLTRYWDEFDDIFVALKENGYEAKYWKEIADIRDGYQGFTDRQISYDDGMERVIQVNSTNRNSDPNSCLAKYRNLVNGGYKSIGSFIYLKAKIRSSLLLKNWNEKGVTHKKFLANTDQLFEFGFSGKLSYKNLDAFSANTELLAQIQKAFGLLYNCYYKKGDLKSLDFRFIWNSYLEIKKVKAQVVEVIRVFDITESFGGHGACEKMFEAEKEALGVVVKDLEGWMSSNIKYQEVDEVLDNQFKTKHRRLQNKWVIGMNRRQKIRQYKSS